MVNSSCVVLGNFNLSEIIRFAEVLTGYPDVEFPVSVPFNDVLRLPFASCSPGRECGLAAPDRCFATLRQETAKVDHGGPSLLGVVVSILGRLAVCVDHRQTRDGHRLASERLPVVLDLEGPARKNRKARRLARSSGPDPYHEPCQPTLGCAAHPRRITQARY